jgi:surface antigen
MRLYRAIILLTSFLFLQQCATHGVHTVKETQQSIRETMPAPMMLSDKELWTMPGMLWNGIQYMRFNLNQKEKMLHQSTVFHSLNNAEIGSTTSWYSKDRLAAGKVRIIHQFPTSAGYCRTYQAYIQVNGASKHFTNNACKDFGGNWIFLK